MSHEEIGHIEQVSHSGLKIQKPRENMSYFKTNNI